MNRRELGHLGVVLLAATLARALLFDVVGVWGDAGLYHADAELVLAGQTPFVDFIGRSPAFIYAYAGVASVFGNFIVTLRAFVSLLWLATLLPVYAIARHVKGHRAGLVAAALIGLSPFMLSFGFFANTQSLAALTSITAVAVVVGRPGWPAYALAGALVGLAFLSRRSAVAVLAGIILWLAVGGLRRRAWRATAVQGLALVGWFAAALAAAYALLAGLQADAALAIAESHAWALVDSAGRGGFPLLGVDLPPGVATGTGGRRVPIVSDVCQRCSAHTVRELFQTVLLASPLVGPLVVYPRAWLAWLAGDRLQAYTGGLAGLLVGYAAVKAAVAGLGVRALGLAALGVFAAAAALRPPIDRTVLHDEDLLLVVAVCGVMALAYLYRPRRLFEYYFADFVPFVAVLAGVILVELWEGTHG